jgi:hypothetical protein
LAFSKAPGWRARGSAPNQARVYAAFGTTTQDGHWKFGARRDGIAVWAADVSAFLATTLQ